MVRNLQFRLLLVLVMTSFFITPSFSQTPFYSQDFSNGIPQGWVRENLSGNNIARWTWCTQHLPDVLPTPGCPFVFNDIVNKQSPFRSSTANNGFAVFDSYFYFSEANIFFHNSILQTTPINCIGKSEVWLKFESHIGVFNFDTKNNAVVEVSTDSINWTTYNFIDLVVGDLNPGISGWSLNPRFGIIDISNIAINQPKVYLRWRWRGEAEYYWALDDIELYEEDPSALFIPENDIRLTDFYAIAPNYNTPISQVESFGFLADLKNEGRATQTNITLNVNISDTSNNTVVYSEQVPVEDLGPDSLIQNILLPSNGYRPDAIGDYVATYEVAAEAEDQRQENNTRSFPFIISENTFAKEDGILSYTSPLPEEWPSGANKSWGWGNSFYCPKGDDYVATSISFSIERNLLLTGDLIKVALYQWRDINGDKDCQEEERFLDPTASVEYIITGSESDGEFITVELNGEDGVQLSDDGEYIAMIESIASPGDNILQIAYNNNLNYGGMFLRSDTLNQQRYGSFLWLGAPGNTTFDHFGFGLGIVPCVRMNIELGTNTRTPLLAEDNKMKVFPNPASQKLYVDLELKNTATRAALEITSIDGKLMQSEPFNDLKKERIDLDLAPFPSGIYFIRLVTEDGILTRRFVRW